MTMTQIISPHTIIAVMIIASEDDFDAGGDANTACVVAFVTALEVDDGVDVRESVVNDEDNGNRVELTVEDTNDID